MDLMFPDAPGLYKEEHLQEAVATYLDGLAVFIELKILSGTASDNQKERHRTLIALGYPVHVVKAETPQRAVKAVAAILHMHGVREAQ